MSEKRYYWLKLPRDFFKRHDIKFIKTLPNGREIAFFYTELMAESIDHDGELRFSPEIPYSEGMLAALMDTPIEIVTEAMKVLKEFGLVKVSEDGTIILPKVIKMIDSASDTDGARRVRRFRERQQEKLQNVTPALQNVTATVTNDNESKSKSKSKSKNIKENIQEKSSRFVPPTLSEVKAYCQERNNGVNPEKWFDFYTSKNWMIGKNKMIDWKAAVRTWEHGKENKPAPRQSTGNQFFDLLNQEASS